MTTAGLFFSRVRDSAAVLVALGIVVFIATLALGYTLTSVQQGVDAGSGEVLDSAAPRSAAVRITTHLADDDERQSAAALGMIDRLFPEGTVEVHSAARSLPVDVLDDDASGGSGVSAIFGVEPDLLDYATITAGDWPADGVAVQEDAAATLGLDVGDAFSVGDAADPLPLTVAALWRADDPAAPSWFAESAVASGHDGDALGVIVVDAPTLRALPTQLFTSWTISATHDALGDGDRAAVATGLARLHDSVKATADVVDVSSSTEGSLGATLDRIADAARGAAAITASAIVIVSLLAAVALVQLSSVLVGSRRGQSGLVRARGLSLPQLSAVTVAEALLVAVPASLLGVVLAAALLPAVLQSGAVPVGLAVIAGATVLATVACLLAVVLVDARAGATEAAATRSPAAFVAGGSLVAVAAAFATVQLYNRATVSGVDLVGATSPALALVAAAVLGTALLYPVAAAVERTAARRGRVGSVLAARQLSRQVARYLVPVLALAVALASAVFATGLASTWAGTERSAQFVGIGSDVSVALSAEGSASITAQPFASLDGADEAAALVLASVTLGEDRLPFVALRPDSARRVLGPEGAETVAALQKTTPDDAGLTLPADAAAITAAVQFAGNGSEPTSTFDVGVWAADADGSLVRIPLQPGTTGWSAPLPAGPAPWTLLAVETLRTGKADPAAATVEVSRIAGDPVATALIELEEPNPRAIAGIALGDEAPLPVVITTALAQRIGLAVGDPISFDFEPTGKTIEAVVAAVTPRVPGSAATLAVATDLAALDVVTLRPGSTPAEADEVWIATAGAAAATGVSDAVARTATTTAIVASHESTSSQPIVAAALTAFWFAAAAAALLALVALGAFFTDDFRRRRSDISVLRALGFSPRQQAATRGREQLVTVVLALLVGTAAGAGATALTVGPFIASAAPESTAFVSVVPSFDPVPWLVFCAALTALACAVCLTVLVPLRRAAADAVERSAT